MNYALFALGIILLVPSVAAMHINEIMYNPEGADNNKEFVEVKGTANLSGYGVGDNTSTDPLVLVQQGTANYSIIVEEGFNSTGLNCSVYSVGSSIGNGLNNDQDTIRLFLLNDSNQSVFADTVSYTADSLVEEGYSLSFINHSWTASPHKGGTPCLPNAVIEQANTTPDNHSENTTLINDTLPVNETESSNNATNLTPTPPCNVTLKIASDKTIYQNKETIAITNLLSETSYAFAITYWVEDLQGKVWKEKHTTTNTDTKAYTPTINQPEKAFLLKNQLTSLNCTPIEPLGIQEKLVLIHNQDYHAEPCPVCPTCPSCPVCPVCKQDKTKQQDSPQATIHSFYTRAKKIKETINLFASVEGVAVETWTLDQLTPLSKQAIQLSTKDTLTLPVPVAEGNNTYLLRLWINHTPVAEKTLTVERPVSSTNSSTTLSAMRQESQNTTKRSITTPAATITGAATMPLYETSQSKVKNYLNYGLVMLCVVGSGIFLTRSRYGRKKRRQTTRPGRLGARKNSVRNSRQAKRSHRQVIE